MVSVLDGRMPLPTLWITTTFWSSTEFGTSCRPTWR